MLRSALPASSVYKEMMELAVFQLALPDSFTSASGAYTVPGISELALTRLQLAELQLEHYPAQKAEAIAHLDFAIVEFREMKMQPSLERALKHKGLLTA